MISLVNSIKHFRKEKFQIYANFFKKKNEKEQTLPNAFYMSSI